jgi:DUF1680 family protein
MRKNNFRICLSLFAAVLFVLGLTGCGQYPAISDNPLKYAQTKLYSFGFGETKATGGLYLDELEKGLDYYYGMHTQDIMHDMRKEAGLPVDDGISYNWEDIPNWFWASGRSIVGQWLSGYARAYAYTGDEKYKRKVDDIVDIMAQCIEVNPGIVIDPVHYSFEKALTSFLDAYEYCGNQKALAFAALTMERGMKYLDKSRVFGNNGDEWYILCEALYRAAAIFDSAEYFEFAPLWEYRAFWDVFVRGDDLFAEDEYGGFIYKPEAGIFSDAFHAYSHLNSLNSAAWAYRETKAPYFLDAMKTFYAFMQAEEVMATGGFGPDHEHLLPPDRIAESLSRDHDHFETQCDTYAAVRLSNYLMNFTGKASYGDWAEKLLYNATLATIPMTEKGNVMYYSDYNTGGASKTNRAEAWTCCSGTRLLGLLEYGKSIYFHDTKNIYVNLFTDSELNWARGGNTITLSQQTVFPKSETTNFTVTAAQAEAFGIKLRCPDWLKGGSYTVEVNGEKMKAPVDADGWIAVKRTWNSGDRLSVTLPMPLYISSFEEVEFSPYAVMEGPVALCLKDTGYGDPTEAFDSKTILQKMRKVRPLEYKYADDETLTFKPYYQFAEGERYYLYMAPAYN